MFNEYVQFLNLKYFFKYKIFVLFSQEERLKIFEVFIKKMLLGKIVDLEYFVRKCEYFFGVDIKVLLYNVQLEFIYEFIGKVFKGEDFGFLMFLNDGMRQ